jgi:PAS domain-containing protein
VGCIISNVTELGQAATVILMNRLVRAAADIVGAEAGFITLSEPRAARVIARCNIPHAFLSTDVTIDDAPFARDKRVLIRDASTRADIHNLLGRLALPTTGFYLRLPLRVREAQVFGLTLFGPKALPDVTERQLALVDELAGSMIEEIDRYYPEGAASLTASMHLTMSEIGRWLEATDLPCAIIGQDMRIRRVNDTLARLVNLPAADIEDRLLSELDLPARDSIAFLFRHALASGFSTPGVDIFLNDGERPYLPPSLRSSSCWRRSCSGAPSAAERT